MRCSPYTELYHGIIINYVFTPLQRLPLECAENTSSDRLVSCCSAYSIIKCCYCQQSEKIRVNISLAKSASIGYRLKIEMATDGVCLHFKINSWFALIHEK